MIQKLNINFLMSKCMTCKSCIYACILAHSKSGNILQLIADDKQVPVARLKFEVCDNGFRLIKCNHCESAPCIELCPQNAISRDKLGFVQINEKLCNGCGNCSTGCNAIFLHDGLAYKCDGCSERIANNKLPACVESCLSHALII